MLVQPARAWLPCEGYETASPGCTTARLNAIIDQFNVAGHPRYKPLAGKTFCNIFLWDFTSAMGCEIPHWMDDECKPCAVGSGRETAANLIITLLGEGEWGWRESTEPDIDANAGMPTIACWHNPSGPGHVAVVRPGSTRERIVVAQAGRVCAERLSLRAAFGSKPVRFFTHE